MIKYKTYKLSDLCDLVAGFAFKSKDFGDFPNKVVKIADIQPPVVNTNDLVGVDMSYYDTNKLRKYIVTKGDYVLAMTGATIGKLGRLTDDVEAYINQRVLTFRPIESIVDKDYLYYQLCSDKFNKYILNHIDSETAQPNISAGSVGGFEISLPSLEEQRRIAGILGAIDDKIENNRRINANLELQAQALFDKWCESCSKNIIIKELADNILDYTPNANSEVVLLNSSDVTQGVFAKLPLVSNVNLKGQFKKRFQKGDILYSEIRPRNKHYAYCYFDSDRYIASTRLIVLRGKKEKIVSNTLLYQYLISQNVFEEFTLKTETRSGTFPQGNYQDLSSIVVPYSDNQKEIAASLDVIYEEIWSNYKANETLATLRDTLLPKLMNGEIKIE